VVLPSDNLLNFALLTSLVPDFFAMLKYCYQHDEWRNTEEVLRARLGGERGLEMEVAKM
jgi:hypothetical protein